VKIEKKNLALEEYLDRLDFNNLEKDLVFSDLDDEGEEEGRIDYNSGEEYQNESSLSKTMKMDRRKSTISYSHSMMENSKDLKV
jgi:hypothetical protein